MAEITLPRAGPNRAGRRGGTRLPRAADVPTVRPPTDPGLNVAGLRVPAGAFGGFEARALGGLGRSAQFAGVKIDNELQRQQRQHDAIKTTEARLEFERQAMEELRRRQVEDDPSRPAFMSDFESDLRQRMDAGIAGLEDVSEEGVQDLRLKLEASLQSMVNSAGNISLKASSDRAEDAIERSVNQAAAQAVRDPDSLLDILADIKGRLAPFKGTLTADQERDQLEEARAGVILGAIEGYVRTGRFDEAELIMASGAFDEDLTPAQRVRATNMIEVGERSAIAATEKAEKELEEELEAEQELRHAKNFDGILDGTITELDLELDLDGQLIDPAQFIIERRLIEVQKSDDAIEDDPGTVLEFRRRIEDGTLTPDEVMKAYGDKLLKRERMDSFLDDIRRNPDDAFTSQQKRRMRENIGGQSGPMATYDEDDTNKINRATDEFERLTRGPDKQDPVKVRKDLEAFYGLKISTRQMPYIRGANGQPTDVTNMDMTQSRKAVGKDALRGKITPAEAKRLIDLLKEIQLQREEQQ